MLSESPANSLASTTGPSHHRSKSKELSASGLALLGISFLAIGIFIGFFYFSGLFQWWQTQDWVEVPCHIESAAMQSSKAQNGNAYKATASYYYAFADGEYRGDRVSLEVGSDHVGGFELEAHQELVEHQKAGEKFRCYVNPEKPWEAILYRELRWPLLAFLATFVLAFPAIGGCMIGSAWLTKRAIRQEIQLREKFPASPWKWKVGWVGGLILESKSHKPLAHITGAIWFWLIIAPLVICMILAKSFSGIHFPWSIIIFLLVGAAITGLAINQLLRRALRGGVHLKLQQHPVNPGGSLRGEILFDRPIPVDGTAEVVLECRKSIKTHSGDGSSIASEIFWSHQENIPLSQLNGSLSSLGLPIEFKLPLAPETTVDLAENIRFVWNLYVMVPGRRLRAHFEIPVFCSGGPSLQLVEPDSPMDAQIGGAIDA